MSFFLFCRLVWTLFTIFTCVHLWANYSAVTSVIMETLNQARLHILVNDFFSRESVGLPSIKDTNFREPVIYSKLVWYDIERKKTFWTLCIIFYFLLSWSNWESSFWTLSLVQLFVILFYCQFHIPLVMLWCLFALEAHT